MTIASEKVKNASERFILVRIEPARYVLPTSVGGGVYETTFPYLVSRVQRNGTDLTLVTSLGGTNDQYTYDESTGVVQMKLASAPTADTNVIVVFYYLFYTGVKNRAAYQTPTSSLTPLREWRARISQYPSFFQSFSNIRNGVLTVADSQIKLINDDREFQSYLTDDDSFYNKKIEIWQAINGLSNIQKVYSGLCKSLSLTSNSVTIEIVDLVSSLKRVAYMGDSEGEAIFTRETGSFPDLQPSASGRPCPYIMSSLSRFKSMNYFTSGQTATWVEEGTPAYCTDYDNEKLVTTNRVWGLCRSKTGINMQVDITGTITSVTTPAGGMRQLNLNFNPSAAFSAGETLRFQIAAVDHYAYITGVSSSYLQVVEYTATPTTSITHIPVPRIAIAINGLEYVAPNLGPGTLAIPFYHRDYTVADTATSGGNYYSEITFTNDFEATIDAFLGNIFGGAINVLAPDIHTVSFRIKTTVGSVFDEMALMIQKCGLTVDPTSFEEAEDQITIRSPAMHIPNIDEDLYGSYLDYIESMLFSTLCYLKTKESGAIGIGYLTLPDSTDTRDQSLVLDGMTGLKVNYDDLATSMIFYNPHVDPADSTGGGSYTLTNEKAKHLHGTVNVNRVKHCMEIFIERLSDHLNLLSNRNVTYSYTVATEDIDTELGDDVLLSNPVVLGTSEERSVKIISIDKSSREIIIEASDLLGISDVEA